MRCGFERQGVGAGASLRGAHSRGYNNKLLEVRKPEKKFDGASEAMFIVPINHPPIHKGS